MAVYRYKHEWCGMEQDIFLEGENRNTVAMPCYRCGRSVVAHQVRDKSVQINSAQGTTGILRKNETKNENRRRSED